MQVTLCSSLLREMFLLSNFHMVTVSKNPLSLEKEVGWKQATSHAPYCLCSTLVTFVCMFPFCWSLVMIQVVGKPKFPGKSLWRSNLGPLERTNCKLLVRVMWFASWLVLGLLSLRNSNLENRSRSALIGVNIVAFWLLF